MPPDTIWCTTTVALYVSECVAALVKSGSDRGPSRPPTKPRQASGSHVLLRSSKKKGSESRQMRTFLRYKYYFLNLKETQSPDPRNIPNCYLDSNYFIFFIILHTATCAIGYHKYTIFIMSLLTSPSEFTWQIPRRCHPPQSLVNTYRSNISFFEDIKSLTVL